MRRGNVRPKTWRPQSEYRVRAGLDVDRKADGLLDLEPLKEGDEVGSQIGRRIGRQLEKRSCGHKAGGVDIDIGRSDTDKGALGVLAVFPVDDRHIVGRWRIQPR